MASNWIKVEVITPDKPEIFQLAEILNIDPDAVLGKMIRVWAWADQQTIDGNAKCNAASVTKSVLDRVTCATGFANALLSVGWLVEEEGRLIFPNHERHNGESSKKRALTNSRVAKMRDLKRNSDAKGNASSVTHEERKALPEEEEEEEVKDNPPLPPKGKRETKKFNALDVKLPEWISADVWAEWVAFRIALKKPIKTAAGITGTFSKLEKFRASGHQPADVIAQSIANEWQGLFEIKTQQQAFVNIDFAGTFNRLVLNGKEPRNEAERKALRLAQSAGLRRRNEVQAHAAWRGYLNQAYKETGEKPETGV